MIATCAKCGRQYERFNVGGYQEQEPHKCKSKVPSEDGNDLIEYLAVFFVVIVCSPLILLQRLFK